MKYYIIEIRKLAKINLTNVLTTHVAFCIFGKLNFSSSISSIGLNKKLLRFHLIISIFVIILTLEVDFKLESFPLGELYNEDMKQP
jgi:hypothetical protein